MGEFDDDGQEFRRGVYAFLNQAGRLAFCVSDADVYGQPSQLLGDWQTQAEFFRLPNQDKMGLIDWLPSLAGVEKTIPAIREYVRWRLAHHDSQE